MKRAKLVLSLLAVLLAGLACYFVLKWEKSLVVHPKGIIARGELNLIHSLILHMLVIVVPTFIILFVVAWRYRANNRKAEYDPEHSYGVFGQLMLWILPAIIVASMSFVTWEATHKLDPYRPLDSEVKPLTIQVVAIDWKWLFIYPEQGIAAVNFVQFPAKTPIRFEHAADSSPMNSFWLPELSGQIYSMAGMVTPLHVMADEPGVYRGRAAEINGIGYAKMTFVAKSSSNADFEEWVKEVKKSPQKLTKSVYNELIQPSEDHPVTLYSEVEKDLFDGLVMKYMHPPHGS